MAVSSTKFFASIGVVLLGGYLLKKFFEQKLSGTFSVTGTTPVTTGTTGRFIQAGSKQWRAVKVSFLLQEKRITGVPYRVVLALYSNGQQFTVSEKTGAGVFATDIYFDLFGQPGNVTAAVEVYDQQKKLVYQGQSGTLAVITSGVAI